MNLEDCSIEEIEGNELVCYVDVKHLTQKMTTNKLKWYECRISQFFPDKKILVLPFDCKLENMPKEQEQEQEEYEFMIAYTFAGILGETGGTGRIFLKFENDNLSHDDILEAEEYILDIDPNSGDLFISDWKLIRSED